MRLKGGNATKTRRGVYNGPKLHQKYIRASLSWLSSPLTPKFVDSKQRFHTHQNKSHISFLSNRNICRYLLFHCRCCCIVISMASLNNIIVQSTSHIFTTNDTYTFHFRVETPLNAVLAGDFFFL